ncbi:hypothetical protein ABBQ38_009878 [Trebouxia sp. C0009 RCD-2024]
MQTGHDQDLLSAVPPNDHGPRLEEEIVASTENTSCPRPVAAALPEYNGTGEFPMNMDLDHMRIRLILNLLAVGCLQLTIIRHMIELLHESMQTVPIRNSDSAAEPQ